MASVAPIHSKATPAEQAARVDLACAYRFADAQGWSQLIYNHISLRVPGEPRRFFMKPHAITFGEVTASSIAKLELDGAPPDESIGVNSAGYAIHSALLRARADVNAIVHIHTDAGIAISAHREGLRFMSQAAMRFYGSLAYHAYHGIAEVDEGPALAASLGRAKAMILRNHGLLTVGAGIAEAMSRMSYLMSAIKSQLMLEAAGAHNIIVPAPALCERAAAQWNHYEASGKLDEWPAMLRWAERSDPSFKE